VGVGVSVGGNQIGVGERSGVGVGGRGVAVPRVGRPRAEQEARRRVKNVKRKTKVSFIWIFRMEKRR
jgi:hypothetical protein